MKIHVGVGLDPLSGHLNIDPSQPNGDQITPGDFRNLDQFCGAAECTELIGDNVLDCIPPHLLYETLKNWTSKLRHGGKIQIGGTDLVELCKAVINGHIKIIDAVQILHGDARNTWTMKYGQYTASDIVEIITQLGLEVTKVRINGTSMIVEAKRD